MEGAEVSYLGTTAFCEAGSDRIQDDFDALINITHSELGEFGGDTGDQVGAIHSVVAMNLQRN